MFVSLRSETNINDCFEHKCENNGTCIDRIESYVCHCRPGYDGEYCETRIQWCDKRHNPCSNGGVCQDLNTHYQCVCQKGWTGMNCTEKGNNYSNKSCKTFFINFSPFVVKSMIHFVNQLPEFYLTSHL